MPLDDPVQDRVGGGARDVGSHGAGPSGFRAVRRCLAAARQSEAARSTEPPECNTRRNRALHYRSSVGAARARGRIAARRSPSAARCTSSWRREPGRADHASGARSANIAPKWRSCAVAAPSVSSICLAQRK